MAGGLAVTANDGEEYHGKLTCFVILACMMAAMGGVIFGYDIGISGLIFPLLVQVSIVLFYFTYTSVEKCEGGVTSMEPFLKKFFHDVYIKMKAGNEISNYCKFDSELLTSFTSSLYVAGLFATFVASSVTSVFGRKASILLGGANFLAGAALGGAASNIYMLIFGRVLLGVGVGFANQVKYSSFVSTICFKKNGIWKCFILPYFTL